MDHINRIELNTKIDRLHLGAELVNAPSSHVFSTPQRNETNFKLDYRNDGTSLFTRIPIFPWFISLLNIGDRDYRVDERDENLPRVRLLHLTLSGFSFNCHDSIGRMWRARVFSLCEEKLHELCVWRARQSSPINRGFETQRCRFSRGGGEGGPIMRENFREKRARARRREEERGREGGRNAGKKVRVRKNKIKIVVTCIKSQRNIRYIIRRQ